MWLSNLTGSAVRLCLPFALALSLLSGCQSALTVKDTLPPGTPKGFVEFYYQGEVVDRVKITEMPDQRELVAEIDPRPFGERTAVRVAVRPGSHTFLVRVGRASEQVSVSVADKALIPVGIRMRSGATSYSSDVTGHKKNTAYALEVSVEQPRPLQ